MNLVIFHKNLISSNHFRTFWLQTFLEVVDSYARGRT